MNNNEVGYEEDRNFAINLFKSDIANSEILYSYFEEKNIFWIDDIDLACQMVIKTLKAAEEDQDIVVLPLYKDKDDEQDFVRTLLRQTVNKQTETLGIIDKLTDNWELDRIAKMDILILQMAITELMVFKSIPTKVTLNEYIEIAKYYSTEKSPSFINGILDKAISSLTASGQISKMGKGLIN
jgi:N utilization substance protein B